jgi:hypothetical protein
MFCKEQKPSDRMKDFKRLVSTNSYLIHHGCHGQTLRYVPSSSKLVPYADLYRRSPLDFHQMSLQKTASRLPCVRQRDLNASSALLRSIRFRVSLKPLFLLLALKQPIADSIFENGMFFLHNQRLIRSHKLLSCCRKYSAVRFLKTSRLTGLLTLLTNNEAGSKL